MVNTINSPEAAVKLLTPRENQILQLIVLGYANPDIAGCLALSIKTVEWHRMNLMKKLDIHKVADLVRFALQNKLVDTDGSPEQTSSHPR